MSRWARKLDKLFPGTPTCNQNGVTFPERLSIYTYIERSEKFNQIVLPQLRHTSQPFAFALIKLICLWIIIAFILKCAFYSSVLLYISEKKNENPTTTIINKYYKNSMYELNSFDNFHNYFCSLYVYIYYI